MGRGPRRSRFPDDLNDNPEEDPYMEGESGGDEDEIGGPDQPEDWEWDDADDEEDFRLS